MSIPYQFKKEVNRMGMYVNPGKNAFQEAFRSEIFIDKTEMLHYVNSVVRTKQKYLSVSRPRRFGKTMAVDMLCAYYDRTAESRPLFEQCLISQGAPEGTRALPWDAYLGGFDVIRLVMTDFFGRNISVGDAISKLQRLLTRELRKIFEDVDFFDPEDLIQSMQDVYGEKGHQFVIIIDEWDAIFREYKDDREGQRQYLDFLRNWLKDKEYVALAYMTGILPIKKYGVHSALNMFDEYSMIAPMQLAPYTGFTVEEVQGLCDRYHMKYEDISEWYDGYQVKEVIPLEDRRQGQEDRYKRSLYNPLSVVKAIRSGEIHNYWNETETYIALAQYIDWNFEGLKEDVAILMDGGRIGVDITGYQNDMTTFNSKDDILTMLIHLGYLGYDSDARQVFIPNKEVLQEFKSSTKSGDWTETFRALENSRKLLEATWKGDERKVAELIEAAHGRAGNRTYHSEAGLSYAIQLAYYSAQDMYTVIPELDAGKGYADLAYIPKTPDKPALLIELKYEKDADSAIEQIHRQEYPDRLALYRGNLILVGINYDRTVSNEDVNFKHHSCRIERA